MQPLTVELVRSTHSDDELFDLLGRELSRRLPNGRQASDGFVRQLRELPPGLRAMAATYELDVSLAMDDLGWHFGNWHHIGLAEETVAGLRELGATRMAEIVSAALALAKEYWRELGEEGWPDWYRDSPLERSLAPLNDEAWSLWGEHERGLFHHWLVHARAEPERLC
jgi:hypothetical protein